MIQRIQTLWLFLSAIINIGLFYFCLYKTHIIVNGMDTLTCLRVNDHYPSLLIAVTAILFPLFAIFLFRNRKRQRGIAIVGILANLSFITLTLLRVNKLMYEVPAPANSSYRIASVLPVIAVIFIILAIRGINKDAKLVKAADRLR